MRSIALASVLALAAILAAGCKGQPDIAPDPSAGAKASASASNVPRGHVRFLPAPSMGDVETIVRDALASVAADKRRLVVYEGATWCDPCQRFHKAAERGELDATFPDLTLLEFDADRDGERLASAGYTSKYIPLFAVPAKDGSASGKQTEGGSRGDGAVASITPRLQGLLAAVP